MPYDQPGHVITVPALTRAVVKHGKPVIENGIPGVARKVDQLGAYVDPSSAAATDIAVGKSFEQQITGIVEVTREGNLATADVGAAAVSDIYIDEDDNALGLAAQGVTAGELTATWQKFGKVVERDASRTPQVLRVSLDLKSVVAPT